MPTQPRESGFQPLPREPAFTRACYRGRRPRAFAGVIRGWPALDRWTPSRLREVAPDLPVQVSVERADGDSETVETSLHSYLEYFERGDFTERRHLREFELLRHAPALADDARFPDFARRRDMLDHRVSFGLPGARGKLHFDYFDSFICAIRGRTRLITMPRAVTELAYMNDDEADIFLKRSRADAFDPDFDRFPRLAEALAQGSACTLEPGDIVYLPAGCLHQIEALEPTLTLITTTINPRRALTVLPRELIKATLHGMGLYKAS